MEAGSHDFFDICLNRNLLYVVAQGEIFEIGRVSHADGAEMVESNFVASKEDFGKQEMQA